MKWTYIPVFLAPIPIEDMKKILHRIARLSFIFGTMMTLLRLSASCLLFVMVLTRL